MFVYIENSLLTYLSKLFSIDKKNIVFRPKDIALRYLIERKEDYKNIYPFISFFREIPTIGKDVMTIKTAEDMKYSKLINSYGKFLPAIFKYNCCLYIADYERTVEVFYYLNSVIRKIYFINYSNSKLEVEFIDKKYEMDIYCDGVTDASKYDEFSSVPIYQYDFTISVRGFIMDITEEEEKNIIKKVFINVYYDDCNVEFSKEIR